MDYKSKNIQLQYQGYLNTPLLWKNHTVLGLEQLELPKQREHQLKELSTEPLLLGKRVERFVIAELQQYNNISIRLENAQINHQKITIGELDCILIKDEFPIHLEIIYKFYLYDANVGTTEIEHWIGPNRKDTLAKKLHKLKDKQLPLLFNEHTKPILNDLHLNAEQIQQRVCFKAQLFIPYQKNIVFDLLNKECLAGFYIPFSEVEQFTNCNFYIPVKIDWLLKVQTQVEWLNFSQFYERISPIIANKTAPLCWVKFPNGMMQKFFIVWWVNS